MAEAPIAVTEQQPFAQVEKAPPYVAFKTFMAFIESLRIAMPGRIDRSVMHTMSGGTQTHMMHALRVMGLVSAQGIPTDLFKKLVLAQGEDKKKLLADALRLGYPFLFDESIDLATATGKQLLEEFGKRPMTGDTIRKSVSFFLSAGKEAGLALSPYFSRIQSRSAAPAKRGNGTRIPYTTEESERLSEIIESEDAVEIEPPEKQLPPANGESLTIKLKSGGTLTISASTSFFKMSADDRSFVFDIIDRLQKYELPNG